MGDLRHTAVIGPGIAGTTTALMLAKNPRNRITLICPTRTMLDKTSSAFSQLHLGGEYPKNLKTMQDCLLSGAVWKLLMPPDIYTEVPPKRFLIDARTDKEGQEYSNEDSGTLTYLQYLTSYEYIRQQYEIVFNAIQKCTGWSKGEIERRLFGSPAKGAFFSPLLKKEYEPYGNIAGGIETQERGLNPIYLARIQAQLESLERQGRIEIVYDHKVAPSGIRGNLGDFKIHCTNGKTLKADQVVAATWQGTPEIIPQMGDHEHLNQEISMNVYHRAIQVVDLPPGWNIPPAFVMMGEHGGMVSPYNDKIALCYIPREKAAYDKETRLDSDDPQLPPDWADHSETYLKNWNERYFAMLKERFPMLAKATNPRLIVADTINFEQDLSSRMHHNVHEVSFGPPGQRMVLASSIHQEQTIQQWMRPLIVEVERGLFTVITTKGTYALGAAVQAASMIDARASYPWVDNVLSPDPLAHILGAGIDKFSLADMPLPEQDYVDNFLKTHPNVQPAMLDSSWPDLTPPRSWQEKIISSKRGRERD